MHGIQYFGLFWLMSSIGESLRMSVLRVLILLLATTASARTPASLTIRMQEIIVRSGSTVMVVVTETNNTDRVILGSRTSNPGEYYSFTVLRDGKPVPETEELRRLQKPREPGPEEQGKGLTGVYMSNVIFEDLQPHESKQEDVAVSRYFNMTAPGKYSIRLRQGKLKSNVVTVTVTP
jgi:hypothetical protein